MRRPKRSYAKEASFDLLKIRRFGHYLSGMIMPNVSVFITWGIITTFIQYLKGPLQQSFIEMDQLMIQFLLPVLIAYTGGRLIEKRAGVVAAVAVIGMLVDSEDPQILGAMVIGPLTAGTFFSSINIFFRGSKQVMKCWSVIFRQASSACCLAI
jgi:PTS system mannitol-specific IIC component